MTEEKDIIAWLVAIDERLAAIERRVDKMEARMQPLTERPHDGRSFASKMAEKERRRHYPPCKPKD